MQLRLTLVSAPVDVSERYGSFAMAGSTEPSFALVSLAAVARAAGADVRIVEASSLGLTVEKTLDKVVASSPDVVGITATTVGIAAAGRLAGLIKSAEKAAIVVVGGCHATAMPEETLKEFSGFDLVVAGEGERTLLEILEHVAGAKNVPRGIPGTVERDGSGLKINPRRALIENLDELPLPAWSLLPGFPRAFRPSPARVRRWPCASVVLSRGCPNQCTFCDRSVFGNRCRAHSAEYAVRLFLDLRRNYGVREILVEDDTFLILAERIREFCERLIAEKVDISWSCLGRADRVDRDLLVLMKAAGCWHISYGIESGDPAILKSVRKNLDLEQIRQAVRWSREAGLRTKGFFILGFPGETHASLKTTREFALSIPLDDVTVMQMTPFPGSELYAVADKHGEFDRDWLKMSTLKTVFVPSGLLREDLEAARRDMLRAFYLRPAVLFRQLQHVVRNPASLGPVLRGAWSFAKVTWRRARS